MSTPRDEPVDVLLIENDSEAGRHIREAFDGLETEVSIRLVTDGDEALTRLTDDDRPLPDLVLLDLDLPRTGGLELLEVIADDPELARLPVLALANPAAVDEIHEIYELAANASLAKPTDPEEYTEMAAAVADFWFRRAALPTWRSDSCY